jgi:glycerol-3-phosphate dehydrogenase
MSDEPGPSHEAGLTGENFDRDHALSALKSEERTLLIIGGGITGASIAREAALRGIKVGLVEQYDFGWGTSSRSSKLVHGGIRYLEQFQFGMVFESLRERAYLRKMAGHLVRYMPFIYPVYRGAKNGLFRMRIGMLLYDILSLFRGFKWHKIHRVRKLLGLEPRLRTEGLKGGAVYYDGWTDDALLTLSMVQDAASRGALCVSRVRFEGARVEEDKIVGAYLRDLERDERFFVPTQNLVFAAGPFTDEARKDIEATSVIRATKGIHIVVPRDRLPVDRAVVLSSIRDGRVNFVIPREYVTVIGTTDTDFSGDKEQVRTRKEDVDYLLETMGHFFPDVDLERSDVIATYAGLRPLINQEGLSAYQTSREHEIFWDERGILTICGGKLTTCRLMGEEAVSRFVKERKEQWGHVQKTRSHRFPLWNSAGLGSVAATSKLLSEVEQAGVEERQARHLVNTYGTRALLHLFTHFKDRAPSDHILPGLPYLWAEVDLSVKEGFLRTSEDFLVRRTQIFYSDREQGLGVIRSVSERIAKHLGFDQDWIERDVQNYQEVVDLSRCWLSDPEPVCENPTVDTATETQVAHART